MSLGPSSATYLASAIRNHSPEHESFQKFYECWLTEQNNHLHDLTSAANSTPDEPTLCSLIDRVVNHYEDYYKAKAMWSKHDVLAMLTPSWRSSLEEAFLWIGGWRPSMAFHLLYSKSGLQLEAAAGSLGGWLKGMTMARDLASLSPGQLSRLDVSQMKTIKEEKDITEKMAKKQEKLAGPDMVELSHVVTELMMSQDEPDQTEPNRVESVLAPKEKGLEEVLQRADDLRLRTLKGVIEVLTPDQAVHFLIAAAELHLRLHEWGRKRDADHSHH
ncbi:TGA transcription factor [Trema orientale]|uniref:TGA transcription factor n=1 Tax=Trema orientale TaxID=63057 RepID=A0A2P5E306_TREOI|nr:TGA transcription factor [Trema orientale]